MMTGTTVRERTSVRHGAIVLMVKTSPWMMRPTRHLIPMRLMTKVIKCLNPIMKVILILSFILHEHTMKVF